MIEGTYCNMFTFGVVTAAVGFFTIGTIAMDDDDLERTR